MATIELADMVFFARHGYYEVENVVGGRFVVSLRLKVDCKKAGETDQLDDAFNYQQAYDAVKEEMAVPSALLEHVSARIIKALLKYKQVEHVWLKLSKINPPMGGEMAAVSIEMESE